MSLPEPIQLHLNTFNEQLSTFESKLLRTKDDEDEDEYDHRYQLVEKRLVKLLRSMCALIRKEATNNPPYLPDLLEAAQTALNKGITFAYDKHFFDFLPSFAHDNGAGQPLVLDTTEGRLQAPAGLFSNFLSGFGLEDRTRGQLPPGPWKPATRRHPLASRLAAFRPRKLDLTPTAGKPLASIIYDARCEIQSSDISEPMDMCLSGGSECLGIVSAGGMRQRDPYLEYYILGRNEVVSPFTEARYMKPGLAELARHITIDETRRLMFVADKWRIKSFAWAAPDGQMYDEVHPTHTLNSSEARGPLTILPNGAVARAGVGQIMIWDATNLETHGASGKKMIGKKDRRLYLQSWSGDDDIELSSGSPATSYVRFAQAPKLAIGVWEPLTQTPSMMICQSNIYDCTTVDIEHGAIVSRYLGHGGYFNSLSVSSGDPQTFLTACYDGFARLFDIRTPLPVLTLDACQNTDACNSAVLTHPDGIPTVFTGACKAEQIKVWDLRALTPVYELGTGNNNVTALAWDSSRSCLYAATNCRYKDWLGSHPEYRYAKGYTKGHPNQGSGEDSGQRRRWPENAWHSESDFDYMFDAGDHRLYRYAFKEVPDVSVVPEYGDA